MRDKAGSKRCPDAGVLVTACDVFRAVAVPYGIGPMK